jgi:TFIIF-interacting CTD phosphatase-like protein
MNPSTRKNQVFRMRNGEGSTSNSATFAKSSRGISVDNNKKTSAGLTQMTFQKLVTQSNRNAEMANNNLHSLNNKNSEKVHSLSPPKNITPEVNHLIPPQAANKLGKKTLILDLDETLIHSGFQPFPCGADIILKVKLIV